jgi:hypothetical protein
MGVVLNVLTPSLLGVAATNGMVRCPEWRTY